ncbi:MAG: hypothetical protein NTV05_10090 [Acidobacteria bacterium]|nr:hypothetical protein [Acidobacteriota bacterium]
MLHFQPIVPTIVKIVPPPTEQVGVLDVLVGAVGLTGVIAVGSIVLGAALGALIIACKKRRATLSDADGDSDLTRLDLSSRSR